MLESGNLLIRMKYDIALTEQATLGGTKLHSTKVMMLLVLAFYRKWIIFKPEWNIPNLCYNTPVNINFYQPNAKHF